MKQVFLEKIATRSLRVAVIGLGYVGLPLATTFAEAGFSVDFFRPRIISVPRASRPSIEQAYNAATAPGLGQHSDSMCYEPYVRFRFKFLGHRTHFTDLKVGYGFYQQLGQSTFSFQRLSATSKTEYGIELPSEGTASHRPA